MKSFLLRNITGFYHMFQGEIFDIDLIICERQIEALY